MTNQINHIVEHLFHKKRLDDVSVYEIERFIATHPYFAAGHFLLAKKTQLTDPHQTHDKVATTLLYYNNPLWLQWLLDQDITSYVEKSKEKETATDYHERATEESQSKTNIVDNHYDQDELATHSNGNEEADHSSSVISNEVLHDERPAPAEENPGDYTPAVQQEGVTEEHREEFVDSFLSDSLVVPSEADVSVGLEPGEKQIDQQPRENEEALQPGDSASNLNAVPVDMPESLEQTPILQPTLEEQSDDEDQQTEQTEEVQHSDDSDAHEEESRATAASIGRTLTTAALIPTRAEIEKGDFTFEPYHTIDYFASQGIKLQQSDLSRDKFGKQLKSFTEWLKSMKRLPQAVAEANMDEATQQSIQRIAEHSFEEKDIVTETMAEVWIKQGNKEKAIDTLRKLSLINPSKSHYFAAKIEQLKAS